MRLTFTSKNKHIIDYMFEGNSLDEVAWALTTRGEHPTLNHVINFATATGAKHNVEADLEDFIIEEISTN